MYFEKFIYFYPEKPTLVSIEQPLFQLYSTATSWVAEPKYNGSRLQLHIMDGKPEFWDRHGKHLAYKPTNEILSEIARLLPTNGYYVFDGELRHNKVVGVRNKIILYDVHIFKNELLRGIPFSKRREILESLLTIDTEPLGIPKQYTDNFKEIFDTLIIENDEFEGLVMKKLTGILDLGRTSGPNSKWMKKVRKKTGRHYF